MSHLFQKHLRSVVVALTVTSSSLPLPTRAQTYPIDCAILLCLSGGWPASVPCAQARAEFIRRVTPWPIEPPLQIWRCPMAVSYETSPALNSTDRILEAYFQNNSTRPRESFPVPDAATLTEAAWSIPEAPSDLVLADWTLQLVQDRADIDISGPEFNFVRSIRVFDVYIDDDRHDEECDRYERVRLGSYGLQGEFRWQYINRASIPPAFGPIRSGCSLRARAVFVEWRDFQGNYGFERVDY